MLSGTNTDISILCSTHRTVKAYFSTSLKLTKEEIPTLASETTETSSSASMEEKSKSSAALYVVERTLGKAKKHFKLVCVDGGSCLGNNSTIARASKEGDFTPLEALIKQFIQALREAKSSVVVVMDWNNTCSGEDIFIAGILAQIATQLGATGKVRFYLTGQGKAEGVESTEGLAKHVEAAAKSAISAVAKELDTAAKKAVDEEATNLNAEAIAIANIKLNPDLLVLKKNAGESAEIAAIRSVNEIMRPGADFTQADNIRAANLASVRKYLELEVKHTGSPLAIRRGLNIDVVSTTKSAPVITTAPATEQKDLDKPDLEFNSPATGTPKDDSTAKSSALFRQKSSQAKLAAESQQITESPGSRKRKLTGGNQQES